MLRKIIIPLLIVLTFSCKENLQNKNAQKDFTLINAVPIGSTLIIETQSLNRLRTKLYESALWETTKDLHWNIGTKKFFDQIIEIIPEKDHNENFIITSTLSGGNSFDYLLLKYVGAEEEKEYKNRLQSNYTIKSIVYDKVTLYTLEKGEEKLYFAIHNNVFLLSEEKLLVEEGIRQLNADISILSKEDFKKIYEATDSNKDANLFIQYTDVNQLAKNYFENADTKWMKFFADWSAIEIDFSSNTVELEGVTLADYIKASYGSVFRDIKPGEKEIVKELPGSVTALVYITIGDYMKFSQNYDRYLNTSQVLYKKQRNLETYKEYDPIQQYAKWIGSEAVVAYLSEEGDKVFNQLFMVQSTDDETAKQTLGEKATPMTHYRGFEFHQLTNETILQDVFGNYVEDLKKPFYMVVEGYVVFANSENTLKTYVNDIVLENYFIKNKSNADFMKSFNSKAHVFAMGNGVEGIKLVYSFLNKEKAEDYKKNEETLAKINHAGIQFNFDGSVGYTQCLLNVAKNEKAAVNSMAVGQVWNQSFTGKIKQIDIVQNHNTKEQELVVHDDTNTLSLVSNSGKKLWEKKVEEPILGSVKQMDIFRNGRLQLVFNTASKLYVLDRNGKEVKPFPIKLKKTATAGCGLFDYDHTRNYRILVPQGTTMTMYNQSGNEVKGFQYDLQKDVDRTPEHVRLGGKDYIVTTATDGSVVILNRVGKPRITIADKFDIKGDIAIVQNQIVFQTNHNETIKIDFNGKVSRSTNAAADQYTKTFKNGTLHVLQNEAVFKGENTIEYDLDEVNDYVIDFYEDDQNQFLIIVDNTLKQVVVVDAEGEIVNGFPVFGEKKAKIYKEGSSYYLITESTIDNSVMYYKMK